MVASHVVPHVTGHAVNVDGVVLLACAAAGLMGAASWGGIQDATVYARETVSWRAQGMGQDWVNLLCIVPVMLAASVAAAFGSRRGTLLQGGLLLYTLYSYVIYAMGVHFNGLFLTYCAALGTSFFGLTVLIMRALRDDVKAWFSSDAPVRAAGIFQVCLGLTFAVLWLSEDLPALARGQPPASLAEVGLMTNPVHVLDLSLALPAMILSGVLLMRGHPLGYVLSPVMLGFGAAMATAIGGMVWFMTREGVSQDYTPVVAMGVAALGSTGMLVWLLACVKPDPEAPLPVDDW